MLVKERKIKGLFEINLMPHEDHRGYFMRTYDDMILRDYGLHQNWVQENHSYSKTKNVIRGLHFQFPPHSETKLIRVVGGEIYMVCVDIRKGSFTLGHWDGIVLSDENKKMLYVSRGFAIGMCTLTDHCTLLYKMDNYYSPENQGVIKWDDPDIEIDWPIDTPIISERDSNAQSFEAFLTKYGGLESN